MATKPKNNNNNIVVMDSGAPTGTGPSPLPMDGTTDNTDDKVITTLVTTEPPILMLTGFDVAAIMLMTYIANHGGPEAVLPQSVEGGEQYHNDNSTYAKTKTTNFHNQDEYGGALLFDDEYAEIESLAGQLGLSAGQLGLSNKERLPGSRRPVVKSTGTATGTGPEGILNRSVKEGGQYDSSGTGNDEEQVTGMVTTGPQIMLTGLYVAALCKLETNEERGSTKEKRTTSLNTIIMNLFDFLAALLLMRPLYSFDPAIGVRIVSLFKEEINVNLLDLPFSLLTSPTDSPLSYMDSASIRTVSTLNKQCRAVVRGPLMESLYRPLLHISASKKRTWAWMEEFFSYHLRITTSGERENNLGRLLQQLSSNRDKLQHYTEATIIDANQFDNFLNRRDAPTEKKLLQLLGLESLPQLLGLESLTISSKSPPPRIIAPGSWQSALLHILQNIMPNIQRINFNGANFSSVHGCPLWVWPRLTKITWNGIGISDFLSISGSTFGLLHNLREMYMDDSNFCWNLFLFTHDPDQFIFQKCCKNLERLSIRNARHNFYNSYFNTLSPVPQQELIKFVRNAPSLKWFRSDLTLDNIAMLQKERPDIELLS